MVTKSTLHSPNGGTGWTRKLAWWTGGVLAFETLSGLSIWILPFSRSNQLMVLVHTLAGLLFLIPCSWYLIRHWLHFRRQLMTYIKLLGYAGVLVLALSALSGLVLTWQALFGIRISYVWDTVHTWTTFGVLAFVIPHVVLIVWRDRRARLAPALVAARRYGRGSALVCGGLLLSAVLPALLYRPPRLNNEFPPDYSYKYGPDRPFAPSLARTDTGRAFDARSLAGSQSCGTAGCHEQILQEWQVSAHRYSAMDVAFQKIQWTMAEQNGPESTRYCGGCHDPISLFSGTKNLFTDPEQLTGLHGYQEGVSCLSCHGIRETDLKGNAHYVITQPVRYLFELEYDQQGGEVRRRLRDFLIRAYPWEHVASLSKQLFKTPEYCAACHKQFIDEEINNVGWVQLQNQFDNWRKSRWNHPQDPRRTIECRECHMPLVESRDPAAGDSADYNRSPGDGRHRSHRFVAANQLMPALLKLPGWEEQVELTEKWLRGEFPIPEIEHKWEQGPAVAVELLGPAQARPGEPVSLKAVITSNKVGHDFPTGPLDIIQAWIEIQVRDSTGRLIFSSGTVDEKGFIQPGSFIFKAEPVDQYGNLIDRHNLWEMVGVRHRRALFPGFSDTADFEFFCPELFPAGTPSPRVNEEGVSQEEREYRFQAPQEGAYLEVTASLKYRKVDQYLINYIFGEEAGLTSPVTEMSSDRLIIPVSEATASGRD